MCPTCGLENNWSHRRGVLHRRIAEIRRLIDEGRTNEQIARAIDISLARAGKIVGHLRKPAKFPRDDYRTKLSTLLEHMDAGRWDAALKLAAKFQQLGEHKGAITRGASALNHPEFHKQLGKDPAVLVAAGIAALKERYGKRK